MTTLVLLDSKLPTAKGHRLAKVRFTMVKCPTCGAQPTQNQHGWRKARKCACVERKALARKVAGILGAHFVVARRPCTGEAHKPEVGGMIDHCMVCMPHWGEVEFLTANVEVLS